MKISVITSVLVALFSLTAFAGNKNTDNEILYIGGKTLAHSEACAEVLVSVYANGELESEFFTNKKGKFDYYLDVNKNYNIVFQKDGFANKTVNVNTYAEKVNFEFFQFAFNVDMKTVEEAGTKEMVSAEVNFNQKRRKFMYTRGASINQLAQNTSK